MKGTKVIFAMTVMLIGIVGMAGAPVAMSDGHSARFSICRGSPRTNCVVDGDTFWFRGQKIRIADIDTPELSPRCPREAKLGEATKYRLLGLLNAGAFSLATGSRDEDRNGRKLRIVLRKGSSIGETLVAEGLARHWEGRRRSWCD